MNIVLAHHWMMSYRGGEKVAEQMAALFPQGEWYTLTKDNRVLIPGLAKQAIHTSELNRIPGIRRLYKHLLPLHPWAIGRMRIPENTDLLLSSDASLIKGVKTSPRTTHVCYCHSPPRYLWELNEEYKRSSLAARWFLDSFASRLRDFDFNAAQRVNHFIANSEFVAKRIKDYYGRDSLVVYPPVQTDAFRSDQPRESFDLVLSELTPYKRIDLAVEAYSQLGHRLVVIGDGSERKRLEAVAKSNVEFVGRVSFNTLRDYMQRCRALVFPGIEDFGITPVEAQAAGAPVIAYRAGGALETVVEHETGVFFDSQTNEALVCAVEQFSEMSFDPEVCAAHAEKFSTDRFRESYVETLTELLGCPPATVAAASAVSVA